MIAAETFYTWYIRTSFPGGVTIRSPLNLAAGLVTLHTVTKIREHLYCRLSTTAAKITSSCMTLDTIQTWLDTSGEDHD